MAPSTISYSVRNLTAPAVSLGTLTQWFEEETTEILGDAGNGHIRLDNNDSQLALCTMGRMLVKQVDGVDAFGFIIDQRVKHAVARGEERDQYTEVSGSGVAAYLDRAALRPTLDYDQVPWSPYRPFTFASRGFDPSAWPFATAIVARQSYPSTFYSGLPSGWCDPDAVWIGPSVDTDADGHVGHWYAIGDFTLAADTALVLFMAADNKADVYFDGFALTTFSTDVGFSQTTKATVFATAGTHRIAVKVSNYLDGGTDPPLGMGALITGNPTAFMCSCFEIDGLGRLGDLAIHTDTGWRILEYPAVAPGFTAGHIMRLALVQAQTDGLLPALTWDFTDANDSAGNAWPIIDSITFDVSQDYLAILKMLATADCDWYINPTTMVLSMWLVGGKGTASAATYVAGTNLTSLTHDSIDAGTDCLIVTWSGGQFRYPDSGGTRLGSFSAGNARTRSEAVRLAARELTLLGGIRTEFAAEIEPAGTTDQPYTGYVIGDTVAIKDETGADSVQRCIQVVSSTDTEGNPIWRPTFRDHHMDIEERLALTNQRYANGSMGGFSTVASPVTPPPLFGSKINVSEVTFSVPDPIVVGEATKDKIPSESGNMFAVHITAKVAASTDTAFEFVLDGIVDVMSGSGVLPAGDGDALIVVDYAGRHTLWVTGGQTRMTVRITTVGTGLAGVLIEPRFLL